MMILTNLCNREYNVIHKEDEALYIWHYIYFLCQQNQSNVVGATVAGVVRGVEEPDLVHIMWDACGFEQRLEIVFM